MYKYNKKTMVATFDDEFALTLNFLLKNISTKYITDYIEKYDLEKYGLKYVKNKIKKINYLRERLEDRCNDYYILEKTKTNIILKLKNIDYIFDFKINLKLVYSEILYVRQFLEEITYYINEMWEDYDAFTTERKYIYYYYRMKHALPKLCRRINRQLNKGEMEI